MRKDILPYILRIPVSGYILPGTSTVQYGIIPIDLVQPRVISEQL